ncbi:MAG: lipid-A-disaccharide synthase [Flavobacteriales bacterium]
MKIYLIAGEASGDLHGSSLAHAIRQLDSSVTMRGWGGDLMQSAGVDVVKHYRELAFMGFAEVIANIRTIMRNFRSCKEDILTWKPDVLLLIDYPGFNLRMAEWAKKRGIRVFYYISPQVWAWKENRVYDIIRHVDQMAVVLPFEQEFYARYHYPVWFVGHPLLDALAGGMRDVNAIRTDLGLDSRPVIALLPGSRRQEIRAMLPKMLEAAVGFPGYQFVLAAAPSQPDDFYAPFLAQSGASVKLVRNRTYDVLRIARAGLVTSGTATLEAGLIGTPQVVCYRGNTLSYWIARRLIKVKYISLVNLILDRRLLTELIQGELTTPNLIAELKKLTDDGPARDEVLAGYEDLRAQLGGGGASMRTAKLGLKKD